jgi:undecaprenyl-diphosphatase
LSRVMHWLQQHENQVFLWVNRRNHIATFDFIMRRITHFGGASITIASTLGLAFFTHGMWRVAAIHALAALALSHIPVAILKKKYPRLRPYLVIKETKTYKNPLVDHSFPSGHTTAIFSVIMCFAMSSSLLAVILVPIGMLVAYSRMYLGLHYPSDCIVGALLGTSAALLASVAF